MGGEIMNDKIMYLLAEMYKLNQFSQQFQKVNWECSSNCVILKIISQISVYLENKYPAGKLPKPNLILAYSI